MIQLSSGTMQSTLSYAAYDIVALYCLPAPYRPPTLHQHTGTRYSPANTILQSTSPVTTRYPTPSQQPLPSRKPTPSSPTAEHIRTIYMLRTLLSASRRYIACVCALCYQIDLDWVGINLNTNVTHNSPFNPISLPPHHLSQTETITTQITIMRYQSITVSLNTCRWYCYVFDKLM